MTIADASLLTSDGVRLQAETSTHEAPRAVAVISHPHPTMGGDMYTPVPSALFRALDGLGMSGVRYNFRGVGRSEGQHDDGNAEQLDVAAAIEAAASLAPDVPLVMAGWSWGADMSLMTDDPRVAGWLLCAAPFQVHEPDTMPARLADAPKHFAVPEHDQFSPPEVTAAATEGWTNTMVTTIADADHFFSSGTAPLIPLLSALVDQLT